MTDALLSIIILGVIACGARRQSLATDWQLSAQLSRKSSGVLRFGPCDGAMTLPSGPMAGSRSGRDTLVSAGVAPGGGSSPPLRPQATRPNATTSAMIAVRRARRRSDKEHLPQYKPHHIGRRRQQHGQAA